MRKINSKINTTSLVAVLIVLAILLATFFVAPAAKNAYAAESTAHTYTESTDEVVNPAAGFYKRVTVTLSRNNSSLNPSVESGIAGHSQHYGIIQLCFDLAAFSTNAKGQDAEIDGNALSAIGKVFGFLRKYKVGAIVRFDYDRDGKYGDREPELNLVLSHIASVAGVISQYSDVVLGVESGMLGPWGEQHSTTLASSGSQTYYKLVQAWLDNTPNTMGITVRRPLYFTYWANEKFKLNLNVSDLASFDFSSYQQVERVGVFNDGYLGSYNDLGTFTDRAAETAFIGKQAEHTYYGGELVADGSLGGVVGNYNSVSNLEQEAFVTHTSYLNRDWNDKVFDKYDATTYTGSDPLYNGNTTEFMFVKNRLGYRFYLSQSYDAVVNQAGEASFKFTIANAGFARILVPSTSVLVFTNGTNTATVDCNVDLSQVPSGQSTTSAGTKQFELSVPIPEQLPNGNYDVYLRFYTEYGAEIRMANDLSVCAPDRQGVKIASVTKSVPVTLSGITVFSQPTKTIYTVGETLDLTGLVVTATYSDGSTNPLTVTTDMLSGYDMSTLGTQTVTVTHEGKTATFNITVKKPSVVLTGIAVTSELSKTTYKVGETLDLSGLIVTATYSNGTTAPVAVTPSMLSGYNMSTAGTKTVTVTYVDNDVTKTATFTVTVIAVTLIKIDVTTPPAKTVYMVGETLDLTGLVVTATYSDGSTESVTVTADMLSGYDMDSVGTQTVTVVYLDKAVSFSVTVKSDEGTPPPPNPVKPSTDTNKVVAICIGAVAAVVCAGIVIAIIKRKKK